MRSRHAGWVARFGLAVALAACDEEDDDRPVVPIPNIDAGDVPTPDAGQSDGNCLNALPHEDLDRDNFNGMMGDCDECDPRRNPRAMDLPVNGIDEDCRDGDAPAGASCDRDLDPRDTAAEEAVKALGLCTSPLTGRGWGLDDARWSRLDGSESEDGAEALHDARQVWLPEWFGEILPREGSRLLVLSTGVARDRTVDAYTEECDDSFSDAGVAPPEGFPRDSSRCGRGLVTEGTPAYDDVGLELELRVPSNTNALAFDSLFLTHEYPDFVCRAYNDFFVAIMDPEPPELRDEEHGNILFDVNGDPIGVNTGLLNVCVQTSIQRTVRDIDCLPDSEELLAETGFARDEAICGLGRFRTELGGASTGWLHTEVPVEPGKELTLTFRLWDSADPLYDSTVLIDNLQFLVKETPPEISTRPISAL